MDLITELPCTARGHTAIAVFVDKLTKMTRFAPTTTTCDSEEFARLFLTHVVRSHGLPRKIVSDRDARFTGKFTTAIMTALGTRQAFSTSFHPQTDGQTERMNRTLEEVMRHYVSPRHDDWDDHLPMAEFAVNSAVQESTRQTPFFLNYGRQPLSPVSCQLPGEITNPAGKAWYETLQTALTDARQALLSARDRQKTLADRHRREERFAVGQQVLLNTKNLKVKSGVRKLQPRWAGPFKVLALVGPSGREVAARLELPAR
jgi:hypothetical protein